MARLALALLAAAVLCAGVTADAEPAGRKGSRYSKDYKYSKVEVTMTVDTYDRFQPIPDSFALVTAAFTGAVKVGSSTVGAYQAIGYSTNNVTRIGQPFTILTNIVAELGSSGDDTLAFTGTWDINPSTFGFNDVDLAITGGTGKYLGATGDVVVNAGGLGPDTFFTATLNIWVPYLRK